MLDVAWEPFGDPENAQQLAGPWIAFGPHVEERSIAERYLEARGRRLAPAERTWLERQCAAWLSLWEVTEIEPGVGLALCDLLTGETRRVREVSGSRGIGLREAILARIVDHEDASVLDGTHPRALPPRAAAEVVRGLRADLRLRKKVAVEQLREAGLARELIERWEEAVDLEDGKLRAETNSIRRADALRAALACGAALRHAAREPLTLEIAAAVREHEERHYRDWTDHPLPALKGKTPVARAAGRAEVDLLLKELESRSEPEVRVDVSALRRELGLEP